MSQPLILHLGHALLIAAALFASGRTVRLLLGAAGLIFAAHAWLTGDPTSTLFMAGLVAAAFIPLILPGRSAGRSARFSEHEKGIVERLVSGVSEQRARHLIDQGLWLTGQKGDVLTREGEPAENLYYLAEGEARVTVMGSTVGQCRAGDLVGELTALSGEPASATVILESAARLWCAPAAALRTYLETHDDMAREIEHGIGEALKGKLRNANQAIVGTPSTP